MEYKSSQSYVEKRSAGMAVASLVLGISGIVTGLCPYTGFIFGSLAIILGLLSRGGEMTMAGQAKAGVVLGSIGIALSTLVMIIAIPVALNNFNKDTFTQYEEFFEDYNFDDYDFDNYDEIFSEDTF